MLLGLWENKNPLTLLLEMLIGSQKTKGGTTVLPSKSTSKYTAEKNKNTNSKRYI